ncbi:ImcF-related family protein [Pseudomonas umsongensis]|uniref:ImcF-related family protein n=1 Tax=Pseudomonas umsongensis TaxID=198618 RepID=UPI0015BA15FA|nr:ImcF-related family protein [Pseudomonas umsongensis]NWL22269.1 type VI secretion protein VasK [Pseudomonas umsongensis]
MKNWSNGWRRGGAAVWIFSLLAALGGVIWEYGGRLGLVENHHKLLAFLLIVAIALIGYLNPRLLMYLKRLSHREQGVANHVFPHADTNPVLPKKSSFSLPELRQHLRDNHGHFWRRKVRLLLVVGEPDQISAIVPELDKKLWLAGHDTILLWGGSTQTKFADGRFSSWQGLSRWRGLDGVIWAMNKEQSMDASAMDAGVRHLQDLARQLRWQLPLHLWQVCDSGWEQDKRQTQAIGCWLPSQVTPLALESGLESLVQPLRDGGWLQIRGVMNHDFLLRLSRDLQAEGIARWRQVLAPLFRVFDRGVPLRGLWFSLPVQGGQVTKENTDNLWHATPPWDGVLDDKKVRPERLGWPATRIAQTLMLALALAWGAGLLLSFVSNRMHIAQVQSSLAILQHSSTRDEQFLALNELTRELGRLDYRATHGTPWYQRFGLNKNTELLHMLWPAYVEANQRLLRDPAVASLQQQLTALIKLPADSPERLKRAPQAYEQLKAYLMLARPEKAGASFLVKVMGSLEPSAAGVSPGLWHGLSPLLWQFYGEQLAAHPDWRIAADPQLVAQVRQLLLGQLGQRNAEANLYRQVLDASANHYPALGLAQMVGDTEARALFVSPASVPGVFTRQAWEGQVRPAIEAIAEARREEIDWVLSDRPGDIAAEFAPDMLRERLTRRYFQDYASAWLKFLNRLRWQPANSLGEVIDQLTLMSDVRQSPLIALMNTLAYQGQAGTRTQALADSLISSAQKLIAQAPAPLIEQAQQGPQSPLDATFGPLLALLGKTPEGQSDNERLSLQAFLNQVTRTRLTLQQVNHAADPQDMTQTLAQTVFQGKSIDLTDTRAYGSQLAASLGAEWGGIGQTLFVQPLEQAWQRVLQPSASSLNRHWQRAIVSEWHEAFTGRYPFAVTASDASLPMLGQMIRADSGRLEQFLQRELGGLLRKEGSRWVADAQHSQGLRFNPQFLAAINQLSHLADVLFTDGGMGLSFELQGKPVRDVVQTTFTLNGEKHEYFNQKESWQRFNWPGRSQYPGASLTWTSVQANERLFGDYAGTWGLIRLLEQAQVTPLDDGDSRFRVVLKAPDGIGLTWYLRTELGAGPMALLKLRGFKLPTQIFLGKGEKAQL